MAAAAADRRLHCGRHPGGAIRTRLGVGKRPGRSAGQAGYRIAVVRGGAQAGSAQYPHHGFGGAGHRTRADLLYLRFWLLYSLRPGDVPGDRSLRGGCIDLFQHYHHRQAAVRQT